MSTKAQEDFARSAALQASADMQKRLDRVQTNLIRRQQELRRDRKVVNAKGYLLA